MGVTETFFSDALFPLFSNYPDFGHLFNITLISAIEETTSTYERNSKDLTCAWAKYFSVTAKLANGGSVTLTLTHVMCSLHF